MASYSLTEVFIEIKYFTQRSGNSHINSLFLRTMELLV